MDAKQELLRAIDVVEFWRSAFPEWSPGELVRCPKHAEEHPSLSLDESGKFHCFGCGWRGTSVLGYATDQHYGGDFRAALHDLHAKHVHPLVVSSDIRKWYTRLHEDQVLSGKLSVVRGWTRDTQKRFRLGWDEKQSRTTIPIYDIGGRCLDVRLHDSLGLDSSPRRKPILARSGARNGYWFPILKDYKPFSNGEIWVLEGEPDTILAVQEGLSAVTCSGGASALAALPHGRLRIFEGKDVILCLDADDAGRVAAKELAERLAAVELRSLKIIEVPEGKDLTEYLIRHSGSIVRLRQLANRTPALFKSLSGPVETLLLDQTGEAKYAGQYVKSDVIVSGKHQSPYLLPSRIEFACDPGPGGSYCAKCPCANRPDGKAEHFIQFDDPLILDWLYTKPGRYERLLQKVFGVSRCRMNPEVKEWQNIERIRLIPALTNRNSEGHYVTREGFYVGHGIEANQHYQILGKPLVHPKTQEAVLLVREAKGTLSSLDRFELAKSEIQELQQVFSGKPREIIREVERFLSSNVTKIYGRPDLHLAVDLTYHSPLSFSFNGVELRKGSIELLLIGDTRCGKGQVAESLVDYYDLGSVVSGENASLMGLLGGAQKISDVFALSWGAIPLNHGRLVIVDEFTGLDKSILGRLSRVRSEGLAEINKGGLHSRTDANARIIWIANPRKGREIADSGSGVQAILELVETQEDIARFDLALVVSKGEVSIERINRFRSNEYKSQLNRAILRKVVLWIWSRKSDQIVFSDEATRFLLEQTLELSQKYSSAIPLLQGENARFKLAKTAAAVAARCFSTKDGQTLNVDIEHAKAAVGVLQYFYDKPIMGYNIYSQTKRSKEELVAVEKLDRFFKLFKSGMRQELIETLLEVTEFDERDLSAWINVTPNIASNHLATMVRCHAIKRSRGRLFRKRPAFVTYLRRKL